VLFNTTAGEHTRTTGVFNNTAGEHTRTTSVFNTTIILLYSHAAACHLCLPNPNPPLPYPKPTR